MGVKEVIEKQQEAIEKQQAIVVTLCGQGVTLWKVITGLFLLLALNFALHLL